MNKQPIIAQLTDFGLSDAYVGTMKGVMLTICPDAQIVDITHAIQPQNVRQAAYVLLTAFRYFPAHTVYNIVVDPGVGTAREAIAVATNNGVYVAPNNGVLTYTLQHLAVEHAVVLENPRYRLSTISTTFHGRDIFSPASAHLAAGVPITELGPTLAELVKLPAPRLDITPGRIAGEVLHIDHFGNIITSIGLMRWETPSTLTLNPAFAPPADDSDLQAAIDAQRARLVIGAHTLSQIRPTYGMVQPGEATMLVGSSGQLEVGINQGNAARSLNVSLGDPVTLYPESHNTP